MPKIPDGFDFAIPPIVFKDNAFQRLADALRVEALAPEIRTRLKAQYFFFLALLESSESAPRPGSVKRILESGRSDVDRAIKTLVAFYNPKASDRYARLAALEELYRAVDYEPDWAKREDGLLDFIVPLDGLRAAFDVAITRLPKDRGGSVEDFSLRETVPQLAEIFTAVTGEDPTIWYNNYPNIDAEEDIDPDISGLYESRFFEFVRAFLTPLESHYKKSNQGLGKALQRILHDMKNERTD